MSWKDIIINEYIIPSEIKRILEEEKNLPIFNKVPNCEKVRDFYIENTLRKTEGFYLEDCIIDIINENKEVIESVKGLRIRQIIDV